MPFDRSVVITGMGAVSVFGAGIGDLEVGLRCGESRFETVSRFDVARFSVHHAAEVPASVRLPEACTRSGAFARLAVGEALGQAGLIRAGLIRTGLIPAGSSFGSLSGVRAAVVLGTSAGGISGVEQHRRRQILGGTDLDLRDLRTCSLGGLSDEVARMIAVGGPRLAVSTACSSSAVAIGIAADLVSRGRVDLAVTGGAEEISEYVYAGFHSLMSLDPEGCRPFDAKRKGLAIGEGAGILVLETAERAKGRGALPLASLLGYGLACDSGHITAPDATGREVARTMGAALADAGLDASAIDHIDAHGTGTPVGDPAEIRGIRAVFGDRDRQPTVSAMKSMLGHTLGAAGALGVIASVLQIRSATRFRTAGLTQVDEECAANHVTVRDGLPGPKAVLSNSFSFGGNNVSIALSEAPDG